MSDFYDHRDNWYRIELDLNEHKDDTIKHITNTERNTWNAKSDAHDHPYAPLSHVGDDTHITSEERGTWNNKATASDISTAIQTHLTNTSHGYMVPNWSAATVITGANNIASHIATKPGVVYITDNMNSQSNCCDIYINDILVAQFQDNPGHVATHSFMINTNDIIKIDCSRMGSIDFVTQLTDPADISDISDSSLYVLFVPFKTV